MISVSLFLFGATVGWLIVYFVRKYKEHNPKGLRETIVLFLVGGCMELLFYLIDKQVALYAFIAYIIRMFTSVFVFCSVHIYTFYFFYRICEPDSIKKM